MSPPAPTPLRLRFLLLVALAIATASGAADLFVSVDGDNSAPGTEAAPLRTIQKGASLAGPGDTVWIRGGVYAERVLLASKAGTAEQPITIRSQPGETAVIDLAGIAPPGGSTAFIRLANCSYVTIQDLELRNYKTSANGAVPIGIYVHGSARGVKLLNNRIHGVWHSNPVHYNYDSNAHGILVAGTSSTPISDITIEGNELYDLRLGSSEALVLNGNVDGFTVRKNLIHDANNIGIDFIGFEQTIDNAALDYARNGICAENTVYNIDSRFNPAYGGSFSGGGNDTRGAAGIYADGGANIVIERNHVYACNIGIEVGSEHRGRYSRSVTVRNNLIRRNHVGGIFLGGYDTTVGGASACSITHNTVYQNDITGYGGGQIALQNYVFDTTIQHNIIVANPATRQLVQFPWRTGSYAPGSIDWNLYSGASAANGYFVWRGAERNGLASWRASSGQDAHSFFAADPGFVDAAAADFSLRPDAAAIDQGDPGFFYGVGEADYFGNVRIAGGRVDIGMAEAGATNVEGPVLSTGKATDITYSTATLSGSIIPGPGGATVWFEYGPSATYGSRTAAQTLAPGTDTVTVTAAVTGLKHKSTWHFRIVGNNATGSIGGTNNHLITPAMPPPVITLDPEPQLLAVGESASFSSDATGGLPITPQWRKNNVAIPGTSSAAPTYSISAVRLSHSGRYAAAMHNDSATAVSAGAVLAVVDPANTAAILNEDATLTLNARAAAPKGTVRFTWFKDGQPLENDGRITGANTSRLIVRTAVASDGGVYWCRIGLRDMERNTGSTTITYRPKPVMNPYAGITATIVSGQVIGQVSAMNELTGYSAVGLPSGIVMNPKTGAVSGRPNRSGLYTATFYARNLAGVCKAPLRVVFDIAPLPVGCIGAFAGLVDRTPLLKQDQLGGQIRLQISATGIFTGSLRTGVSGYLLRGRLDAERGRAPVLQVTLPRARTTPLVLSIVFDSPLGSVSGMLAESPTAGTTLRAVLQTATTASRFTSLLEPADSAAGTGFLSIVTAKTGVVVLAGKLADGSAITGSTLTGATQEFPFHQLTQSNRESIAFWSQIDASTHAVSGSPTWLRRATGLQTLTLTGSSWIRPAKGAGILGLAATPGEVALKLGGFEITEHLLIGPTFLAKVSDTSLNPNEVTLVLNTITGGFTGRFTYLDAGGVTKRTAIYQGMMLQGATPRGAGYCLLPGQPSRAVSIQREE